MDSEMLSLRHALCKFLGEPNVPDKCRDIAVSWIGLLDTVGGD